MTTKNEEPGKPGFIYFIQAGDYGPIKIGYATDVLKRLASLQSASPVKPKLLRYFEGDLKKEREIHKAFAEYLITGEWFEPSNEVLMFALRQDGNNELPRKGDGHRKRWDGVPYEDVPADELNHCNMCQSDFHPARRHTCPNCGCHYWSHMDAGRREIMAWIRRYGEDYAVAYFGAEAVGEAKILTEELLKVDPRPRHRYTGKELNRAQRKCEARLSTLAVMKASIRKARLI